MTRKYVRKNTSKLELCLWIDKDHPGQEFAKRYYVNEITSAVENGSTKIGWFETIPSIGFMFKAKDFSWVRFNEMNKK